MKTSELIEMLQSILAENGDLEVMCWPYDGQSGIYSLNEIRVEIKDGKQFIVIDA